MDNLMAGSRVNRYEIVECLRSTELIGFYKAYDTKLERFVFLKLVRHGASYSQESVDYFLNEAKSLAKLSHPNIVKVLDFGHDKENLYLINEYNEGLSLAELIRSPMEWTRAVQILLPLTEALAYAHTHGTIHRDLRPENILLMEGDQPLLSDFSLMRIIENEETRDVTGTNVGLGSPAYISPEQGKGLPVDFRSDIYSLGIVFFEMVTGQKPFRAESSMEVVIQQVMKNPPRPSSLVPSLPPVVERIILTALAKDASKRYQSMEEFGNTLRAVALPAAGSSVRPRRRISVTWIVLGVLVMIGLAASGYGLWKYRQAANAPTATLPVLATPTRMPTVAPVPSASPAGPVEGTGTPPSNPTPAQSAGLPALPVVPWKDIPASQAISRDNAASVVELARLGQPLINQVAFLDGNQTLVAATSAGLFFYDTGTLKPEALLDTEGWLESFAISTDEQWAATGDAKGSVSVWNIRTGEKIASIQGGQGMVTALDISPDKTRVAFALGDWIKLWDINAKSIISERRISLGANQIAFVPGSGYFLTGGNNFQINVWDAQTGSLAQSFATSSMINDLSVSGDGKFVAVALENATVEVYDLQTRSQHRRFQDGSIDRFTSVAFLPNNQMIIAGSADGSARNWNINSDTAIWQTPREFSQGGLYQPGGIKRIAVSADGSRVALLSGDGTLDLWNWSDKTVTIAYMGYHPIKRVAVSPNGQVIAYQLGDESVQIYAPVAKYSITPLEGKLPRGNPISTGSDMLLVEANGLNLYRLSSGGAVVPSTFPGVTAGGLVNFVLQDNVAAIASGTTIDIWSTSSGRELNPTGSKMQGYCRVLSRWNGDFLAAASPLGILGSDGNLEFFCGILRNSQATSVKFLPDGSVVALSVRNSTIEVWDATSGQKRIIVSKAPGNMLDVAISGDGSLLAASSVSGVIEIYDRLTLELLKVLDTYTSAVNQVTFTSDQKYIISGSEDGTVRMWGLVP